MEKMAFMCCDGMEIEPKPSRWQGPIGPADIVSMLNDDKCTKTLQSEEFWTLILREDAKVRVMGFTGMYDPGPVYFDENPRGYQPEDDDYDDDDLPELESSDDCDYDVDFLSDVRPLTGLYWWSRVLLNRVTADFVKDLFPAVSQSVVDEQLQLERYFWETCGKALMDRWRELATQPALRAVIAYIAYAPYFGKLSFLRIG